MSIRHLVSYWSARLLPRLGAVVSQLLTRILGLWEKMAGINLRDVVI